MGTCKLIKYIINWQHLLLVFAIIIFSQVSFSNECSKPEFLHEFLIRDQFSEGSTLAAGLGMMTLQKSRAYRKLEKQAGNDKDSHFFKEFIDDLNKETNEFRKRAEKIAQIIKNVQNEFQNKYGKDFSSDPVDILGNSPHRKLLRESIDVQLKANNLDYFHHDLQLMTERLNNKWTSGRQPFFTGVIRDFISRQSTLLQYEIRYFHHNEIRLYTGVQINKDQLSEAKANKESRTKDLKVLLSEYVEKLKLIRSIPGLAKDSEKPSHAKGKIAKAGIGLSMGIALEFAKPAQVFAALASCQSQLGITNEDKLKLMNSLRHQGLPSLVENAKCDQFSVKPDSISNLMDDKGEFSIGVCKLMKQQLRRMELEQEPDFDLSIKDCTSSELTVNGKSIGRFIQVDQERFDFQTENSSPASSYQFEAKFPVLYAGGVDFDPQSLECFQLKEERLIARPSCTSKLKESLLRSSPGGLGYSLAETRKNLLSSLQSCGVKSQDPMFNPLCNFSSNVRSIQLASTMYNLKCQKLFSPAQIKVKSDLMTK